MGKKKNNRNKDKPLFFNEDFNETAKLYSHANEHVSEIVDSMGRIDSCLTVASSGDQLLNLLAKDVYHIDTFDINQYANYYINLRLAGILGIRNIDELWEFLLRVNYKGFQDAIPYLDDKSLQFWNYVFSKFSPNELLFNVFRGDYEDIDIIHDNNYFDTFVLTDIKQMVKRLERTHFNTHLLALDNCLKDKKYDVIYLSNIYDYVNTKKFLRFLRILRNHLTKNGKLYYSYQYEIDKDDDVLSLLQKKDTKDEYSDEDYEEFKDIIDETEIIKTKSLSKCGLPDGMLVLNK